MYQEMTSKNKQNLFLGAFALSFYWVIALWNFWSNFTSALGFNATIFIFGILFFFFYTISNKKVILENYLWVIPIFFIGLSFSLYENPFLKTVNIFLLPIIFSIFFAYSLVPRNNRLGLGNLFLFVVNRILLLFQAGKAFKIIYEKLDFGGGGLRTVLKIIFGSLLFSVIALTIIIPLLSAADPFFGEIMSDITEWFYGIISFQYFGRIAFAFLFAIFLMSYYLSFDIEKNMEEKKEGSVKLIDPIISGIVLGGILLIYILFIFTQLAYLWIDQLPIDFKDTERLVKSGFWQLFFLSIINITFFIGYYRKTNNFVQNILKLFSFASLLILISAGQKMFLYVTIHGFSYEKFFASYTIIYCCLVFVWLIYQLFSNKSGDILKFLIFSLLWMYSILTILPVEQIVFSANTSLSQRKNSRINLHELKMLSFDVLPMVVSYKQDDQWRGNWNYWVKEKMEENNRKKWYEKNIRNINNVNLPKEWNLISF